MALTTRPDRARRSPALLAAFLLVAPLRLAMPAGLAQQPKEMPAKCSALAAEIKGLKAERAAAQNELKKAAPSMKPTLAGQIKKLDAEIAKKEKQLQKCREAH